MTRKGQWLVTDKSESKTGNVLIVRNNNICFLEMNDLVDEMIDAVDDGDGEIDYDEFVKMIQKY